MLRHLECCRSCGRSRAACEAFNTWQAKCCPDCNHDPLPPPPDLEKRAHAFARELILRIQRDALAAGQRIAHMEALGALMAAVALMKGTGASREIVVSYAGKLYDKATFKLIN